MDGKVDRMLHDSYAEMVKGDGAVTLSGMESK